MYQMRSSRGNAPLRMTQFLDYRIDLHAAMQHQMRMKILIQESISPDIQRKRKNKNDDTEEIATTSKNEVSQ